MKKFAIAGGAVLLLPLCGCGGLTPCGGADDGHSNFAYAGAYTGEYVNSQTKAGQTLHNLSLKVSVAMSGEITGTATDEKTKETTSVQGTLIDWDAACSPSYRSLDISFTFTGANPSILYARTSQTDTTWRFQTDYVLSSDPSTAIGKGYVTLTKNP